MSCPPNGRGGYARRAARRANNRYEAGKICCKTAEYCPLLSRLGHWGHPTWGSLSFAATKESDKENELLPRSNGLLRSLTAGKGLRASGFMFRPFPAFSLANAVAGAG